MESVPAPFLQHVQKLDELLLTPRAVSQCHFYDILWLYMTLSCVMLVFGWPVAYLIFKQTTTPSPRRCIWSSTAIKLFTGFLRDTTREGRWFTAFSRPAAADMRSISLGSIWNAIFEWILSVVNGSLHKAYAGVDQNMPTPLQPSPSAW